MTISYLAYYEDAAKVEAAAKARGFTGNDGESWHDFVEAECDRFRASKRFSSLEEAESWLKAEIDAVKSVYGCGYIVSQEPVSQRCQYCVCHGTRDLHEWDVDDDGIAGDRPLESPCLEE